MLSISYSVLVPNTSVPIVRSDRYTGGHDAKTAVHQRLRSGYFGLCGEDADKGGWVCKRTLSQLLAPLETDSDPLHAAKIAADFSDNVLYPGLL